MKKRNHFLLLWILPLFVFSSCGMLVESESSSDPTTFSADKYEPNDSRAQATSIELDQVIEATIAPKGDVDFYKFVPSNNDQWDEVRVSITNVTDALSTDIKIFDEDYNEILREYSTTRGGNLVVIAELKASEIAYIRFSSFYSNDVGRYRLKVENLDRNDEYAPNDSRQQAYALGTLPVANLQGVIVSSEEEDWYKFTTDHSDKYDSIYIDFTNISENIPMDFEIIREDGENITREYTTTRGANISGEFVSYGGTYYIGVKSWSSHNIGKGYGEGEYTLNIYNSYAFDEFEPNGTRELAHNLGTIPVSQVQGSIISRDEEDWFMFTSPQAGDFTISFSNVGENFNVQVEIFDEEFNSLSTEHSNNRGASMSLNTEDERDITPEAGKVFYMKIDGYIGRIGGPYNLQITYN